jgi:two-component system OmpR family response regulator
MPMSIFKLLIVDDDQGVLDALTVILTRAGYEVQSTDDVFGLPFFVGQFKPDAILLDVDLPAVTGDKLAKNLLKLRSTRDCKIIFHSAEDEASLHHLADRTGVSGYIPKGLYRTEFLLRLRALLGGP